MGRSGRFGSRARGLAGAVCGLLAGGAAGAALVAIPAASGGAGTRAADVGGIDAAHVPPLLTVTGEDVTLRYAIVCPPRDPASGEPCDGSGEVFIRAGQSGAFRHLSLERGDDSIAGRWFARVPPEIATARDGFSYYAVLRNDATGETVTLPAGGAAAPQRSLPLDDPLVVDLGEHAFGRTRGADERLLRARWGSGTGELGLSGGPALGVAGPSAFDVEANGTVAVLDQVNRRLERWPRGAAPSTTPIAIEGGTDDLAVTPDGTAFVLEPGHGGSPGQLRAFGSHGELRSASPVAERTWSQLQVGPSGPLVQSEPSEQWMPAPRPGAALGRSEQARGGRPGRALGDGGELVVLRSGQGEIRIARLAGDRVRQSWRILSRTPLGEVQLADITGSRLVVVTKAYTNTQDEFEALVLDGRGLVRRFSVASAGWAETAPLARFHLAGDSLYQLGTTPEGAFVDRFDLGGNR